MLQTKIPQFPNYSVKVALYKNVQNIKEIRSKIAELPYAFVDARTICSVEQIMAAIYRVLLEKKYNRIRTKTLHSECLLCLSPTSNIGEAFKKFGIKDDTKELIVLELIEDSEDIELNGLGDIVDGLEVDMNDSNLKQYCDKTLIKSIYKFDATFEPDTIDELSRGVIGAIQLRGL